MSKKRDSLPPLTAELYDAAEVALDDTDNFYSNWLDAGRQQLKIFDDYLGSVRAGTDAVAKKTIELAASNSTRASHFARKLMRGQRRERNLRCAAGVLSAALPFRTRG